MSAITIMSDEDGRGHDSVVDESPPGCPIRDCILPVDIILEGSCGRQFGAHTANLQQYSEGFPLGESVKLGTDIPYLEESGEVLELMLRFMHHTRQPNLSCLSPATLSSLAEAAEKYLIYSAMELCRVFMSFTVKSHPIDVLIYSFKHDYSELADEAARLTVTADASSVIAEAARTNLHPSFVVAWFTYREAWAKGMRAIVKEPPSAVATASFHKGGQGECYLWNPFQQQVLVDVGVDPEKLSDVDTIIKRNIVDLLSDCAHCSKRATRWALMAQNTHTRLTSKFV